MERSIKISELISDVNKYNPFCPAIDQYGRSVPPNAPWAVKWSLRGALFACYRQLTIVDYLLLEDKIREAVKDINLEDYQQVIKVVEELDV